jgi:hypothetical protein
MLTQTTVSTIYLFFGYYFVLFMERIPSNFRTFYEIQSTL